MFSLTGGCVYYGVDLWPRNNDIDATEKMYTVGGLALAWLIVMISSLINMERGMMKNRLKGRRLTAEDVFDEADFGDYC